MFEREEEREDCTLFKFHVDKSTVNKLKKFDIGLINEHDVIMNPDDINSISEDERITKKLQKIIDELDSESYDYVWFCDY